MTLLYYAPGGGLGHLSRAVKVMQYINAKGIIVTSPLPITPALPDGITHIAIDEQCQDVGSLAGWLQKQLRHFNINRLIVDSFPAGIFGELGIITLPEQRILVSRLLNWPVYQQGISAIPSYRQTWYCEWPAAEQEQALSHLTGTRYWLPLLATPPEQDIEPHAGLLIIHSNVDELPLLLPKHCSLPVTLVTPPLSQLQHAQLELRWPQVQFIQQFPCDALGWHYQAVRCGAGFNLMSEYLQHPGAKFIALPRRFDLQELRLQRGIRGMLPPNAMPLLQPKFFW